MIGLTITFLLYYYLSKSNSFSFFCPFLSLSSSLLSSTLLPHPLYLCVLSSFLSPIVPPFPSHHSSYQFTFFQPFPFPIHFIRPSHHHSSPFLIIIHLDSPEHERSPFVNEHTSRQRYFLFIQVSSCWRRLLFL